MRSLYPADVGERTAALVSGLSPDLGRPFVEFVFGDVCARPGLDAKVRQLLTLGSIVSFGDTGVQVRVQVANALNAGLSEAEITGAILHCAIFAGFARVINAMFVAREVFDEPAAGSPSPVGRRLSPTPTCP